MFFNVLHFVYSNLHITNLETNNVSRSIATKKQKSTRQIKDIKKVSRSRKISWMYILLLFLFAHLEVGIGFFLELEWIDD